MDTKLSTFISNNPRKLFKLARKLFDSGVFNCHLSPQQFNLLNFILYNPVITDKEQQLQLWQEFMNGNISLEFFSDNDPTVKNGDLASSPNNQQTGLLETDSTQKKDDKEEDENFDLNLKKGVTSVRNLLFKVRYLLWEKLMDFYYASGNEKEVLNEYEILDIEDEAELQPVDGTLNKEENNTLLTKAAAPARDEEDDYDDDDDEDDDDEDKEKEEEEKKGQQDNADKDNHSELKPLTYNSNNELVLEVAITSITAPPAYPLVKDESIDKMNVAPSLLGPSSVIESDFEKRNELKIIRNFNKIYHSFENDKQNISKRRKLEESDKRLAAISNTKTEKEDTDSADSNANVNNLINFGGAANLSLKNLLNKIDRSREKLNLTDLELRNLVLDVRKNRSKWASDDKIGQEELYEACERVVLELRGYTEHSTAFLNKVSKREAPNYYQVIKHPMDLNTVMKKLKAFQYKTKQEFVDDLMLIWKNCLTYNSDPSHFIRAHAIAMQKKTSSLIPLIPDITVRDRAEVEKEEAELHKEEEKENGEEPASKATRGGVSSTQKGSKLPKKGKKRTRDDEEVDEQTQTENNNEENKGDVSMAGTATATAANTGLQNTPALEQVSEPTEEKKEAGDSSFVTANATLAEGTPNVAEENEEEEEPESTEQVNEEENGTEDEDLEFQTWSNLTSNARFKICTKRSELFKENKLQPNTELLSRTILQMSNFNHYLGDEDGFIFKSNRLEYLDRNEQDEPYLLEYDVTGGIPSVPYQGNPLEAEDKLENELVNEFLLQGKSIEDLEPSKFVPNPDGLDKTLQSNISMMQEIRRICFKISLIRQMQSQAFVHHTQMKPPEIETLREIDIDPISRLENKDQLNRDVCYLSLKRNVSKIFMANGFETADPYCVDVMTQVAEEYMGNLLKSIKLHSESQSVNKISENKLSNSEVLLLSLVENGVQKPDVLHTYVHETLRKQTLKLNEIKASLTLLLTDMLRPGFQESLNEKAFTEDSEQYLTGDFANEIGDDFFGFRELGLDKEFGLLSQTIPLHLLHARLHNASLAEGLPTTTVRYEDIVSLEYPPLTASDIDSQIGLLKPFYESWVEKSRHFYSKLHKSEEEETGEKPTPYDPDNMRLVEDEELPNKQKNNRPKVPPTGKIPGVKKKLIEGSFFLEDKPEVVDVKPLESKEKLPQDENERDTPFDARDEFATSLQFPLNGAQMV